MQLPDSLRLTYRQIVADDWPFFLKLQQDPAVMQYVADSLSEAFIRDAFAARLPRWHPGSPHWLCLLMRDKESGTPVGVTGYIQRDSDLAEVGFLLDPAWQGLGYGKESLRAVCQFAFGDGGIRRLTATVTAGNEASRNLLVSCGFKQEGTLRESWFLKGAWRDDWLFGLLKHEFR